MKVIVLLVSIFLFLVVTFQSKAQHRHVHDEEHVYHLGFGIGGSKFLGEDEILPGIHIHLLRKLNIESNWSIGFGYEGIAEEEWHHGLNLLVNYRPLEFLSVNLGPGIVLGEEEGSQNVDPAFHVEAVTEFLIKGIHVGPMIGFGVDPHHKHVSIGLHVGFGK